MDAPGLEAALRKAGGGSAGESEEQEKAMAGPAFLLSSVPAQEKVGAGGGDAKGA